MERVERTNKVIVCLNQQAGFVPQQDLYTMEVDQENRNCYNCRGFGHLARNCKNKETGDKIEKSRRLVICKSTCLENTSLQWYCSSNYTSSPYSQHASWWWCNYPGILSSIIEILLFNLIFYSRVTPISVSTLKLLLRVIGAIPLKFQASPIVWTCI